MENVSKATHANLEPQRGQRVYLRVFVKKKEIDELALFSYLVSLAYLAQNGYPPVGHARALRTVLFNKRHS